MTKPKTQTMGKKLTIEQLHCERCDWYWWPRIVDDKVEKPGTCPSCRSPYWNKPVQRVTTSKARKK